MVGIRERCGEPIAEHGGSLAEVDAVFSEITRGFRFVPSEGHRPSIRPAFRPRTNPERPAEAGLASAFSGKGARRPLPPTAAHAPSQSPCRRHSTALLRPRSARSSALDCQVHRDLEFERDIPRQRDHRFGKVPALNGSILVRLYAEVEDGTFDSGEAAQTSDLLPVPLQEPNGITHLPSKIIEVPPADREIGSGRQVPGALGLRRRKLGIPASVRLRR